MTEMSNKEVLDFNKPEETKDFPVQVDGTSALKLDDIPEEQNRGKEIEEVRDEINATQGLTVVEPVNEEVIFEPIKDIDSRSKFTKFADRVSKSIRKAGLKIGTMFLASATLSSAAACGPIEAASSTPEPTQIVVVDNSGGMAVHTSNEAPSETIETTPSPSPEPTEPPLFSEERTAELNQQIQDFNNDQGDFTKERKSEMAIDSIKSEELGSTELGIVSVEPMLQGYFYDYFEKDGSLILIMGFDGKDEKDFTTLVQIPYYFLKGDSRPKFNIFKYPENTVYSNPVVEKTITSKNPEELPAFLDDLKNRVIMIIPALQPVPGSKEDYTGSTADYFTDRNSKVGLIGKLVSSVASNKIEINNQYYDESNVQGYEIPKVESIEDAKNVDISEIPMISITLCYF